jgi:hypothetical protein
MVMVLGPHPGVVERPTEASAWKYVPGPTRTATALEQHTEPSDSTEGVCGSRFLGRWLERGLGKRGVRVMSDILR